MKKTTILILSAFLAACGGLNSQPAANRTSIVNQTSTENAAANSVNHAVEEAKDAGDKTTPVKTNAGEPKTVREFFALLPEKYFTLEGCDKATDKNCDRARAEYLKTFLETEDTQNGYLKAGCDGAQSCLTMALFKRPDGSYLVGVNTSFEMGDDYYFLDYAGGRWTDVSAEVVPEYNRRNMYELPRLGTTVKVFAKKILEEDKDYIISEKGARLYDLEWKDGKFSIRR